MNHKLLLKTALATLSIAAVGAASSSTALAASEDGRQRERCAKMYDRIESLDASIKTTIETATNPLGKLRQLEPVLESRLLLALQFRHHCKGTVLYALHSQRFDGLAEEAVGTMLMKLGFDVNQRRDELTSQSKTLLQWWDEVGVPQFLLARSAIKARL